MTSSESLLKATSEARAAAHSLVENVFIDLENILYKEGGTPAARIQHMKELMAWYRRRLTETGELQINDNAELTRF